LKLHFPKKPDYDQLQKNFYELFLRCGFIDDDDYEWNPKYLNKI